MKKLSKTIVPALIAVLGNIGALNAADNLFPPGNFSWKAEDCEVRSEVKDGRYQCGMFLKSDDADKKKFILFYRDAQKDSGSDKISVDGTERYRDAAVSIKFDFGKIMPKTLYRASFLYAPVKMDPEKTYCAKVYIKGTAPGQILALSLMGNLWDADKRQKMIYKFYPFTTSLMWEPVTLELNMKMRKEAQTAEMNSLVVDVKSPGTFYLGKIEIFEKK